MDCFQCLSLVVSFLFQWKVNIDSGVIINTMSLNVIADPCTIKMYTYMFFRFRRTPLLSKEGWSLSLTSSLR